VIVGIECWIINTSGTDCLIMKLATGKKEVINMMMKWIPKLTRELEDRKENWKLGFGKLSQRKIQLEEPLGVGGCSSR
jgi:hypothetical protein